MEKSGREKTGRTMLAKIWDQHVIARLSEDTYLLHVDRHLLHDLGGSRGLLDIKGRGLAVHNPELTFATPDHAISTAHGRVGTIKIGLELLAALRAETAAQFFDDAAGTLHVAFVRSSQAYAKVVAVDVSAGVSSVASRTPNTPRRPTSAYRRQNCWRRRHWHLS